MTPTEWISKKQKENICPHIVTNTDKTYPYECNMITSSIRSHRFSNKCTWDDFRRCALTSWNSSKRGFAIDMARQPI